MQRGLAGEILARLERRGLRIAGLKLLQVDRALAERHYGEHVGKPFYEGLVAYITACPIVAAVLRGHRRRRGRAQHDGQDQPARRRPRHDPRRLRPRDRPQPDPRLRLAAPAPSAK